MGRNRYWTQAEDDTLRVMLHDGSPSSEIAVTLNRSKMSVVLRKMRLNLRTGRMGAMPNLDKRLVLFGLIRMGHNIRQSAVLIGKSHEATRAMAKRMVRDGLLVIDESVPRASKTGQRYKIRDYEKEKKSGSPPDEELRSSILYLLSQEIRPEDIAEIMGSNYKAVRQMIYKMRGHGYIVRVGCNRSTYHYTVTDKWNGSNYEAPSRTRESVLRVRERYRLEAAQRTRKIDDEWKDSERESAIDN